MQTKKRKKENLNREFICPLLEEFNPFMTEA